MMKFSLAVVLVAGLLGCSSCQKEDLLVPGHTLEWLHQQNGDLLRFRDPATGDTTVVATQRRTELRRISPKFGTGSYNQERITLNYVGPAVKNLGEAYLELRFDGAGYFDVTPTFNGGTYDFVASVETASNSHQERIDNFGAEKAEFLDNTTLAGKTYRRLLYLRLPPAAAPLPGAPANVLRELWYSKDDGLIALSLTTGQHWQRRW